MQTEETMLPEQEEKAKEPNILYVLDSVDGILVPCKTAKGEDAFVPMSLLLALLEKQIARRMRMSGVR